VLNRLLRIRHEFAIPQHPSPLTLIPPLVDPKNQHLDPAMSERGLAVMPARSHTAVINQPDLLRAFIEPFLKGETPKGMFG
jgi:hypothetical protein